MGTTVSVAAAAGRIVLTDTRAYAGWQEYTVVL